MNHSLLQCLKYENQAVLDRYMKDYPKNKMSAKEAFCELIKYMWLCHEHHHDQLKNEEALHFNCVMHAEMREIDDMWHTFLLYTRDYHDFCIKYFGEFFHHEPLSTEDKNISADQFKIELERYLIYIHDKLGEETLRKWFHECL